MIIMIKAIRKAVKKLALRHLAPYTVEFYDPMSGVTTQVIYAWTRQDALEWVSCSLKEEAVEVWYAKWFTLQEEVIAKRSAVVEA
jgi:hypothetical protein